MVESLVNPARSGITILLPPTWVGGLLGDDADGFRRVLILLIFVVLVLHGYPGAA